LVFFGNGREDAGGYPCGADLVVEVIGGGSRNRIRDLEIKPLEYEKAGIAADWAIDIDEKVLTVHVLDGDHYHRSRLQQSDLLVSVRLIDFVIPVADVLSAADHPS